MRTVLRRALLPRDNPKLQSATAPDTAKPVAEGSLEGGVVASGALK